MKPPPGHGTEKRCRTRRLMRKMKRPKELGGGGGNE
jgi:hypothetical protein